MLTSMLIGILLWIALMTVDKWLFGFGKWLGKKYITPYLLEFLCNSKTGDWILLKIIAPIFYRKQLKEYLTENSDNNT